MSTEENLPVENPDQAKIRYLADTGRTEPETLALLLFEQVTHEQGNADTTDLFVSKVIAHLFELSPMVQVHITDFVIADLVEDLSRRSQQDAVRAVLEVQSRWDQEASR